MEELFPVLIFLIIGVANTISKAQKKARSEAQKQTIFSDPQAAPAAPAHPYMPAQPTSPPPTPLAFADVPVQVITPTVHPHVQPDCATHDAPSGSLSATSTEGKDPCHVEQLTHIRAAEEPVAEEGGLTFDWSGENMVKAFVMQEVLTRPANRYAR